MADGTTGTLACAGSMDCKNDKAVAENALKASNYSRNNEGIFSNGGDIVAPNAVDMTN